MMDLIVSWLLSGIAEAFEAGVELFSALFGYDIKIFNDTFSFAKDAYKIIRNVGLALALILAAWQVIVFFTRGADKAPATPIRAALNAVIAVGFIFYGNYIFEMILEFCQYPYDSLLNVDAVKWGTNWGGLVTSTIKDYFSGTSMILMLVIMIMIIISFIKLLLEIVERYVVTFVLVYLSPLASATLASSSTSGIYKKYFVMFISQCLLLFLNVWCLKMACSGISTSNNDNSVVISLILCYSFLRISSKMDSYINQLGLNAAITGTGLGAELFAAGQSMLGSHGGGGGGAGGGNKILGAAKAAHTWTRRINPFAAAAQVGTDAVIGAFKGGSEAFRSGAVAIGGANTFKGKMNATGEAIRSAAKGAAAGVGQTVKNSDNLISNVVGKHDTSVKVPGINSSTGRVGMVATGEMNLGSRNVLNSELVTGALDENSEFDVDKENANISTWASNQHLAESGFSYVQQNNLTVTDSARVSAIAEGLGAGQHSKEVAEFISAGYGRNGAQPVEYRLDATGIHGRHDLNGYEHKTDIINRSQYDKLSKQERFGFEKMAPTSDGKQYFVRSTKKLHEKPVSEKKDAPTEKSPNTIDS